MKSHLKPITAAILATCSAIATAQQPTDDAAKTLPTITITGAADQGYAASQAGTGTKTDTPLMETPLSIQVIPQQILEDQKVIILDQALKNVSGVRPDNTRGAGEQLYLRGFPTSTTFLDGFRIDDNYGIGLRTMTNVESIEVLKGPGAILYGRVEPGGIVNIVTKQPQASPYYSIEQSVGSWNQYLTNLDATGPLNQDKSVLYRVNVSSMDNHSWRDGIQERKLFIAPTLEFHLSPQTQVSLEAQLTKDPNVYDSVQAVPYDDVNKQFIWLPRNQNLAAGPLDGLDTTFLKLAWTHRFNDDWSIKHQIVQHDVKVYSDPYFTSDSGFYQVGTTWMLDRTVSVVDAHFKTTATILDITGHFQTGPLQHTLLLGGDFYRYDAFLKNIYSSTHSTTTAFNPAPPDGLVADTQYSYGSITDNTGLYLQDQIKFAHGFHLLAGLRYQKVVRTGSFTDASGTTPDDPQRDTATTPRFGLLWQASNNLSIYANYAENFGANNGRDWQHQPLPPQSAKQHEIGAKLQLWGGKLTASLALFELTKTNLQTDDLAHKGGPGCEFGCSVAIGEVRSRGPEFDIQGEIAPGWNVIATYTNTDIHITKSNNGDQGLRLPNVPRNMASFWATHEFKSELLQGWTIGGGVTWRDSATDSTNTFDTPGYSVFDAMASYKFKTGPYKSHLQLNINNLFDKKYYTDLSISGNTASLIYGTPRSATLSYKVEL